MKTQLRLQEEGTGSYKEEVKKKKKKKIIRVKCRNSFSG